MHNLLNLIKIVMVVIMVIVIYLNNNTKIGIVSYFNGLILSLIYNDIYGDNSDKDKDMVILL
jgi:hypothetical protein